MAGSRSPGGIRASPEPVRVMKTDPNPKRKAAMFGDFITAVYNAWSKRSARQIVRLAVNAHWVVFRGQQRFVIS